MASTTEELDLLERVFLRIGAAETDEQLENAVNKFLLPVLLKLSSGNEGVRKKVMELLVHVNQRLKRRPMVQLPVEALLKQYSDPTASSFLINFSILYIKMGFTRLSLEKRQELAPLLVAAIPGKPQQHQDSLLLLLVSVVGSLKVPTDPEKKKTFLGLDKYPNVVPLLSNFMLDVLLMPYVWVPGRSESPDQPPPLAPPGLSPNKLARLNSAEIQMTGETLEQTKKGILELLMTGLFPAETTIVHLLVAAADTRFSVTDLADTEINRIVGTVDWSNVPMALKLWTIYLGSPKQKNVPEAQLCLPANTRIRIKLLPYLTRLEKDAICFPFCLQVVFDTLYGANSNAKLKQLALNFALSLVRKADANLIQKVSPMLYTGLLKVVWNSETPENLKVTAYTTIGQIVKRVPSIINKNLMELQIFFDNLSCDSTDVRTAVRDALLCMVEAFKLALAYEEEMKCSGAETMETDETETASNSSLGSFASRDLFMTSLLAAQVEEKESMARFVASAYAATVFPPSHVISRYLLLLCVGDSVTSVAQQAQSALYPERPESEAEGTEKDLELPDFAAMTECIHSKVKARLSNRSKTITIGNATLPFNVPSVVEVLHYLRLCLAKSSGAKVTKKTLLAHPCENSPLIGNYLRNLKETQPIILDAYLELLNLFLTQSTLLAPLQSIEEVVGCCPDICANLFAPKLPQFLGFLSNSQEEVRKCAAFIIANILVFTKSDNELQVSLEGLLKDVEEKTPNQELQYGSLLASSYIIERKISNGGNVQDWDAFKKTVTILGNFLENGENLTQIAACEGLGQLGRVAALPLPEKGMEETKTLSKKTVVELLTNIIKSNKAGSKVKEGAILACGYICLGEEFAYTESILQKFLELSKEIKHIDLHFSIAEAIILCLEGPASEERRDAWRIVPKDYKKPEISQKHQKMIEWLLKELLTLGVQPHPNTRQAVCAYLLCLIKKMPEVKALKDSQVDVQNMFMEFLSDSNEFIQDMASKGLALVYDNTTPEQQKALVSGLLDQLLTGKRAVRQVTADTKIFEEGQLGAAPTGGNLSTYRELCSLASDLNQPDLIYQFMHLANHNAVWDSKKGAAFGFQTIRKQANEQLNEYLPAVIPRLYRYQFDPTPRIQKSMANIWHSIVKNTSKTLDKYQNEIMDDLLANLTSNQWRVRSSCCAAISDFFRGNRSVLDFKPKLAELWGSLFRVMDDVHEGTRTQAVNTCKTLATICTRTCDAERVKPDEELIQILLQIFLQGITNPVAEVRQLSLQTVSQFVTLAGPSLKPSLTTLIPALLEAAGELESVGLSYLSAQFGGQAQAQDLIDSARASVAKSHYTTQTVTKCVQYVDASMLEELTPRILEIMKSVNLGSRVASAHLIVLLAHHLGKAMEPVTGKFLAGLVNGLLDRNSTVRKTYASTIGQILHTAKQSSVERLTAKLNTWYFEKEDGNTRAAIGTALQAIAQYNSELLKLQFPVVIPLTFFAMHDVKTEENKSQVEMWEEVWNEITPGSEAGIRQNLTEIMALLEKALDSPSWNMKAQAGRCISTVASRLDQNLADEQRNRLIGHLLSSVQGRTFRGKEELITALAKVITHAPVSYRETSPSCASVVDTLLREAGKTDQAYKRHSLQTLGEVLDSCTTIDRFTEVYDIVKEMLQHLKKPDEDGEKNIEELSKARNEKYKTLAGLYETLGKAWPRNKLTQLKFEIPVLDECLQTLELSPRDVQVAILCALNNYLDKLHYWSEPKSEAGDSGLNLILAKVAQALVFALGIAKHTRLRKEALNIIWLLGRKLRDSGREIQLNELINSLRASVASLSDDPAPEVRTRLMDLKDLFSAK